jgi:catechol 2,3-dioxygenase-like lactoylglutathione lyase family enzyme
MFGAIHHAALRVADVEEARARWSILLGLSGELVGEVALLRCAHEDYALLLRQSSEKPGLEYVAYELARGVTMDDAEKRLKQHGVEVRHIALPGRGSGLRLDDPDGNGVVLTEYRRRPGDEWPAEVRFSDTLPGLHPRKFGHVNYLTGDVQRIVDWYINVLGFRLTDWIGTEGAWLHVNADHHALAFLEKGYNHIHHLAFELVDWGEMRVFLDHLAQHRRPLVWGPGRHGMARNLFSYWRMPEEDLFVELFADLEQLKEDHEPRHYEDSPHSSNTWGILPPRSYFRFDEAAIRDEQLQLAAYGQSESATVS